MENCLITKLKGVVDNNNLVELGAIKVHVNTDGFDMTSPETKRSLVIVIQPGSNCHIKVVGNGTFGVMNSNGTSYTYENVSECTINYGDEGHSDGYIRVIPNAGDYYINLGCKYNTLTFNVNIDTANIKSIFDLSDFDLSSLNYAPLNGVSSSLVLYADDIEGMWTPFSNIAPLTIRFRRIHEGFHTQGKAVNLDSFTDFSNLTTFEIRGFEDQNDSILKLSDAKKLITLDCQYTKMNGDLADLAAAQVLAGRTSGYITVNAAGCRNITINGNAYSDVMYEHSANRAYIVFNSSYTGGYDIVYTQP